MAQVTRYFSTASAGAADGTTWADRALLFVAGAWNSIISQYTSHTANSMEVRIGPGSYTTSVNLNAATFGTNSAPTASTPLVLHGCDSSGNLLSPPDPDWTSDQPAWSTTGLPVITVSGNVALTLPNCIMRLFVITASGRNGSVIGQGLSADWLNITNSNANTSAAGVGGASIAQLFAVTNCVINLTSTSFAYGVLPTLGGTIFNNRIVGTTAAGSGTRDGIQSNLYGNPDVVKGNTIINFAGIGINYGVASMSSAKWAVFEKNTITNCLGGGIKLSGIASQTNLFHVQNNIITDNGTMPGFDGNSSNAFLCNNRFRNNSTSGDYINLGNQPNYNNYTASEGSATDATQDYVSPSTGDYRIKFGSAISGRGFGVSQQSPITPRVNPSSFSGGIG